MDSTLPPLVSAAAERADSAGFPFSCDTAVGQFLSVLTAHLPPGARVLEMGTGAGVGTAWIVSGIMPRSDITVITVECDTATRALAAGPCWPPFVDLRAGDALDLLDDLGKFDLIFADSPRGKWEGIDQTVAALRPGGLLVVDDMSRRLGMTALRSQAQAQLRQFLLGSPLLTSVEVRHGTGMILSARRGRP